MYTGEHFGLEKNESFIIDWQYGSGGDFTMSLGETIARADIHNLNKLSLGFPDEVDGFVRYATEPGWWERVQKKHNEFLKLNKESS